MNHFKASFDEHIRPAENGSPESQFQVGFAYLNGLGVNKDQELAVSWWIKAAGQGHILAMRSLAFAYGHGTGVDIDEAESLKWSARGAEMGDSYSQFIYGHALFFGTNIPKNIDLGIDYIRKAALGGDKQAIKLCKELAAHLKRVGSIPEPRFDLPQKAGCLWCVIGFGIFGLISLMV
jgi:TPR repeat protein